MLEPRGTMRQGFEIKPASGKHFVEIVCHGEERLVLSRTNTKLHFFYVGIGEYDYCIVTDPLTGKDTAYNMDNEVVEMLLASGHVPEYHDNLDAIAIELSMKWELLNPDERSPLAA